jgi:hypothetical protein
MAEPIFMKLGIYNIAPEPISTAYFMNPPSVCVYMRISLSLLGNGLVKITLSLLGSTLIKMLPRQTDMHTTVKELLDASYSMQSVLSHGK